MKVPEVRKLTNGLRVIIIPRTNVDSVTIHLKGLAGSNFENNSQIGVAHLLEHLNLLKGNKNKILVTGGKILGVTSRDDVLYMVKTLKEDVMDGLEFLSHIFDKNNFSKEDLAIQKKIVLQEVKRSLDKPEKLINTLSFKNLYMNDRMSIKNTGYEHHIKNISEDILNTFHNKYYNPNNFILVVCGKVRQDTVYPYIEKVFGSIAKGNKCFHTKHTGNSSLKTQKIVYRGLKQTHIKICFYGYTIKDEKRYSSIVLASILDSYFNNLIKDSLGLVYTILCNSFSTGSYGVFSINLSCDKDKSREVIKTILEVLNNFQKLVSSRNIKQVKKRLVADFIFKFEKTSQIAEYYSDILTHGSDIQNHVFELKKIGDVSELDIKKTGIELFSQEPKITLLTN